MPSNSITSASQAPETVVLHSLGRQASRIFEIQGARDALIGALSGTSACCMQMCLVRRELHMGLKHAFVYLVFARSGCVFFAFA